VDASPPRTETRLFAGAPWLLLTPLLRAARLLLELSKARITVAVTFSVSTGWVLERGGLSWLLLVPAAGVFLLACGAATLNQIQEWRVDARMARTRGRPIPSGRISPRGAGLVCVAFLAAGFNVLARARPQSPVLLELGLFAVVYYNGVYWWLKRVTAFAVVPGALIGAVPPIIGWCAAGGSPWDAPILEVAAFFFIWQIPHFWLLVRLYGPQYEEAGLPTASTRVPPAALQRMTVSWSLVTAFCGLFLTLRQGLQLPWSAVALVASVALVWVALAYLRPDPEPRETRRFFVRLNAYALVVMLLLMASILT
jgi:protoheme IX farnesyltransferase